MYKDTILEKIEESQNKGFNKLKNICLNNKNIVIFGAGSYGKDAFNMLRLLNLDINIKAFCDNDINKQGNYIFDLKILSYPSAKNIFNSPPLFIIFSSWWYEIVDMIKEDCYNNFLVMNKEYKYLYREISKLYGRDYNLSLKNFYMLHSKIDKTKVEMVNKFLEDEESKEVLDSKINLITTGNWQYIDQIDITKQQYFQKNIFRFSDEEIFLDLGAFDGDTILEFIKTVNYSYKKIIAFEPAENNYKNLINMLASRCIKNAKVYNMGTWNEKTTLSFSAIQGSSSCINNSGKYGVQVDFLDNILLDIPITFIKMDIEGAEKETLLGAKQLIKKYKPKLAICVYHKIDDIYEIPLFIKNLVPEYRIYLRHHSPNMTETVCYACT